MRILQSVEFKLSKQRRGIFKSYSKTLDMTSEWLADKFEGYFAVMCAGQKSGHVRSEDPHVRAGNLLTNCAITLYCKHHMSCQAILYWSPSPRY